MSKKWRLTDRTKMLLKLELALTLPALALMAFSIWNLKHFQRGQAMEAAFQRDFTSVLRIAEKKSWMKANQYLEPIRKEFPRPGDKDVKGKLDKILADHPELDYAILYDKNTNTYATRMQTVAERDPDFCSFAQADFNELQGWLPAQGASYLIEHFQGMVEMGEDPVMFMGGWEWKKDKHIYSNQVYFSPAGTPKDDQTIAVVAFNQDYLKNTFFPSIMKEVLNSKSNAFHNDVNPPAIMIHPAHETTAWVTTPNWGEGKGEVDYGFSNIFQGMVWSIKYPGTTIADITAKFMRSNLPSSVLSRY
jgi:hypothetical protein